jgi:hypothetical protein
MERGRIEQGSELPGFDKLHMAPQRNLPIDQLLAEAQQYPRHFDHLKNPAYDKYVRMHKVFVGNDGGKYLEGLGSELETSHMPVFLDAAGWAFAESGIVQDNLSAQQRVQLLCRAESSWERALELQTYMDQTILLDSSDDIQTFRLALNLAFTPIMKSLVVGNVTQSVRERAFADTLAIAHTSLAVRNVANGHGNKDMVGQHIGFEHECNALFAGLYMDDPRHIPLPSSARADSGYYHREQTHDMMMINQHWGVIRKSIPIEIKATASRRHRQRYKSLVVRGKMHLSVEGKYTPEHTLMAFSDVYEYEASLDQQRIADYAALTMKDLVTLYQSDTLQKDLQHINSHTRFYNVAVAAQKYREISTK